MIKSSPSTSFKTIKALVESSSSENNESDESEEITNKTISPFTTTTTGLTMSFSEAPFFFYFEINNYFHCN